MVYLIELAGCDEKRNLRFELKIGYTGDPEGKKRFDSYSFGNSGFKLLATISDGDLNDEQKIHNYFKNYRLAGRGREYYDYSYLDLFIKFFKDHPDHRSLLSVPVYIPIKYNYMEYSSPYIVSNINRILVSLSQVIDDENAGTINKSFQIELYRFMEIIRGERDDNMWEDIIDFCSLYLGISGDKLLEFTERFNNLSGIDVKIPNIEEENRINNLANFRIKYESFTNYDEQFKYLCQELKNKSIKLIDVKYLIDSIQYNTIALFGIDKCKTIRYRKADAERLINDHISKHPLAVELYKTFKEGHKYSLKKIKEILRDIYKRMKISKTPKATDLLEYFDIKEILVFTDTNKRSRGFLINGKVDLV